MKPSQNFVCIGAERLGRPYMTKNAYINNSHPFNNNNNNYYNYSAGHRENLPVGFCLVFGQAAIIIKIKFIITDGKKFNKSGKV